MRLPWLLAVILDELRANIFVPADRKLLYDPIPLKKATHLCSTFRSPKNPQQKIIKRVIGLEGDFIRTLSYKNRYVRIPDGHFWIEGDHHGHSLDSNSFGPVSVGLLHGRASHIIWPPKRWQRIKASLPPNRGPVDIKEEEG
ncbi:Mitochondrial inner membrane protease subunit 2 [Takifugu flavidus]|uniref:Mitochondrial inner membrane protease subunit 2 n=1 Tax=Takifugu flavidus TaxID=433684 RepID=A0A5C6PAZ3_9TELE|nr:Mitochondrial inner membrane protease subunit 2 [Takifugu flavidus]